jgi:hypothetical protein
MDNFLRLVDSFPWWAWVAIVAVVIGAITSIARVVTRHLERVEKIRRGIDPDSRKGD